MTASARNLFCIGTLAGATLIGCAQWRAAPELPTRNSLVLDQLVVFSDQAMPEHHRLLEELRVQRTLVSTKLSLPLSDEPIHIYLFPTSEKLEAFMRVHYPTLPRRRAFFVESDTRLSVYAYWGDRVAEDLRHEVAHGYLHAVVPRLPLWLDEGLAEYFEVPRGLAGLNRPHVESLSALGTGWKPNLRQLEQLQDTSDMTQAQYAESWAWVHWMLESSPDRLAILRTHLAALARSENTVSLSERLAQSDPNCEQQLIDHLAALRQSLR